MNYYERFPGDYQRDTAHLSLAQHGAFTMLLDTYYATERPLPADLDSLFRIARAMSKEEQAAVRVVADTFFPVDEDGLRHNARADSEIEKARPRIDAAKFNGSKGGRPRKTQKKPTGFPLGNPPGNPEGTQKEPRANPDQKLPILHTPEEQDQEHDDASASSSADSAADPANCPHAEIIAAYHTTLPELPRVREWDADRQRMLRSRWREKPERQSVGWWTEFFRYVKGCPWLMGQVQTRDREPFQADLEWLIRPKNFRKVVEGRYEARNVA